MKVADDQILPLVLNKIEEAERWQEWYSNAAIAANMLNFDTPTSTYLSEQSVRYGAAAARLRRFAEVELIYDTAVYGLEITLDDLRASMTHYNNEEE